MVDEKELYYSLALQRVQGVGSVWAKRLLEKFGTAERIFSASTKELIAYGVSELLLQRLQDKTVFDYVEKEIAYIGKHAIHAIHLSEEHYPYLLKQCADAPLILFSSVPLDWHFDRVISVVGTRQMTPYGKEFCKSLIADLKAYNPVIVSGLAYGVDVTAHRAALENGLQTFAVLGHGLETLYPAAHNKYVGQINRNGGLLTEFWSTQHPDRDNFIRRNRIIAGLSVATVVIESDYKGGSMSTARFAMEYDRDVFALPGRVTDKMSKGCNELIGTHRAQILTSAQDLVEALGWTKKKVRKSIQAQLFLNLSDVEQKVYDYLNMQGKTVLDTISRECGMPVYKVSTVLLNLELKGIVRPLPGKYYELI